jgi:hypothetical protein
MAATITTVNPNGLGYQTGFFSGPKGEPLAQHFFDAAFAGRINTNKIYKEAYHCDIVQQCTMSTWLEEYTGAETDCYPAYTLLETYGRLDQIQLSAGATVPVYPGTVALHLAANSHFVGGQFVLPQVGNTLVAPSGALLRVTAVSTASSLDSTVTVQLYDRTGNTGAQVIASNAQLLVLSGSEIADCACPTGQFAVMDLPLEIDLAMITVGDLGELCGDALNKCQFLKIPFTDECGNVIEKWYTQALKDMYQRFEMMKHYQRLLNPQFGIIPTIKARGMKWTPASPSEITTDDVRAWKAQLDSAGINCREYAIFAGGVLFSQWQRMLLQAGVTKLDNTIFTGNMDCKWINMQYCGISVEGLTLHIYEECTFSNGKLLGGSTSVFPSSAIIMPMCARPACSRGNGTTRMDSGGVEGRDDKMLSTVYFRSLDGRVWDNLTDSNGVLGVRNTFGTGCETQQWSVKSRFLQEVHCPSGWGFMGL